MQRISHIKKIQHICKKKKKSNICWSKYKEVNKSNVKATKKTHNNNTFRKLLYTHVVWLKNTCKRRKYSSIFKCRKK